MARLFRPSIIRYVTPDGKRCTKDAPGAQKKRARSKTWRGEYRDADGILQSVKLCKNKDAARQMLNELERKAERGRAGLNDPFEDHRKKPLSEHIDEFERHLAAKGNSDRHVSETAGRIRSFASGCGFKRIGDLSASQTVEYLADRRRWNGRYDE